MLMFAQERQQRLLELLERRGRLAVGEIQQAIGSSPATIRRDLAALASRGQVVRTHGGVIHPAMLGGEPVFQQRSGVAEAAKAAIAEAAADLVRSVSAVYIDAGTTTLAVAQKLLPRRELTLFTPSLPLLALAREDGARIISIGGEVRVASQTLVDSLALMWMDHLQFEMAVIGASGLDVNEGASVTSLREAQVKQAAMARSQRSVLVADAGKWSCFAAASFARWSDFEAFVTDCMPGRQELRKIRDQGVRIHQTGPCQ